MPPGHCDANLVGMGADVEAQHAPSRPAERAAPHRVPIAAMRRENRRRARPQRVSVSKSETAKAGPNVVRLGRRPGGLVAAGRARAFCQHVNRDRPFTLVGEFDRRPATSTGRDGVDLQQRPRRRSRPS